MNIVQIAYFKHFLFDKGIQKIYMSMYHNHKFKGDEKDNTPNPDSIEQFFMEVHASKVVMKAFYFSPNSSYGFDYWSDINDQWKEYWDMHKNNFSNSKCVTLKGPFGILRQNWDSREYWKVETKAETYKRMKMEAPPIEGENIETAFDTFIDAAPEPVEKMEVISDVPWEPLDDSNKELLDGFSEIEAINAVGSRRLGSKDVSVNLRNEGYRITFSADMSKELRKHCYSYVRYLTNRSTSEIALIFNHQTGCKVSIKKSEGETRNITINSKDIAEHIKLFYDTVKDYFLLHITDTVQKDNSLIMKLNLKK